MENEKSHNIQIPFKEFMELSIDAEDFKGIEKIELVINDDTYRHVINQKPPINRRGMRLMMRKLKCFKH